jgi:hypothetical protein
MQYLANAATVGLWIILNSLPIPPILDRIFVISYIAKTVLSVSIILLLPFCIGTDIFNFSGRLQHIKTKKRRVEVPVYA